MPNIYYDPEKFGLSIVGTVDFSTGYYEFDYLVVWQDENGNLYYGEDSGCSCPSPFEDQGRNDLVKTTPHEVVDRIQHRVGEKTDTWPPSAYPLVEKIMSGLF